MKAKIIYGVIFLAAFVATTAGVIYFNAIYKDIFRFDFTVIKTKEIKKTPGDTTQVSFIELKNFLQQQLKEEFDSLRTVYGTRSDTVIATVFKDSTLIDSLRTLQQVLKKVDDQLKLDSDKKSQNIAANKEKAKSDSTYSVWMKQTAKLYESMDPKRAAKIIQSYSDNVARDIIYTMKQKKAAEVLSELNPTTANRITQAK